MDVIDIKTFVPSKDYEISKTFYSEIGFKSEYVTDDLTLFENGDCLFFLQPRACAPKLKVMPIIKL